MTREIYSKFVHVVETNTDRVVDVKKIVVVVPAEISNQPPRTSWWSDSSEF